MVASTAVNLDQERVLWQRRHVAGAMLNQAVPYPQMTPGSISSSASNKLPFNVRFALFLLVVWTFSQVVSAIPGLNDGLHSVLVKSKVLMGPLALALIALTNLKMLRLRPAFKALAVFVVYSIISLLIRTDPEWQRAIMISAWAGCFLVIPVCLNTPHRIREFIRLTFLTLLGALILAIVIAMFTGDVSESGGGRTRYHFGMNPNYFAAIAATMSYTGFATLILVPKISRTLCWIGIIGGLVLTVLTDCRTQLLMLSVSFAIYGAYSKRRIVAGLCQFGLGFGFMVVSSAMLLIGTPLLSIEQANLFSSGRVLLWYSLIKTNLGSGDLLPILWGQSDLKLDTGLAGWRKLSHMRHDAFDSHLQTGSFFHRVSFDNAYIDTLLMTGAIGLILALWGWWHWWRALKSSPVDTFETRQSRGIAKGLIAGMLVTGLFGSSWPAVGNVSISFGMVLAVALTATARNTKLTHVPLTTQLETWNPPGRIR
jgi:hypothetical protein